MTALAGAVVLAAGCAGGDPGASAGDGEDLPALRTPDDPQRLDDDTALQACSSASDDTAEERVASVVLPATYGDGVLEQPLAPGRSGTDATCAFAIPDQDGYRRPGTTFLTITIPARRPLERGRWRTPAGYAQEALDVVAVQADGVRLAVATPRSASRAQRAAGREAWRMARSSLAVRSAVAADGDPDAESDPGPPEGDTTTLREVTAQVRAARGYRRLTRVGASGAQASLLVPRRLTTTRRCSVGRGGPLAPYDYDEENVVLEVGVDGPLWERYREKLAYEAEGGDEATSDLEYDADLAFPGTGGKGDLPTESLVYTYANDGQPLESHVVQRGGVRVSWQVRPDEWGPQADELPTVLRSLEVRPG